MQRVADKERVNKLIELLKTLPVDTAIILGAKPVNSASTKDSKRLLVNKYSILNFAYTRGLFSSSDQDRINEYVIQCPFHRDKSGSLSINTVLNICHCFSCGAGGNYSSFASQYEKEIVGRKVSGYDILEEILITDPNISALVGFSSIYTEVDITKDMVNYKVFRPKLSQRRIPTSYLEAEDTLRRKGYFKDVVDIKRFIYLVQTGTAPQDIYCSFTGHTVEEIREEVESWREEIKYLEDFNFELGD